MRLKCKSVARSVKSHWTEKSGSNPPFAITRAEVYLSNCHPWIKWGFYRAGLTGLKTFKKEVMK